MIYIFGDSHARTNFKNLPLPFIDCHETSITMHRIGRDQIFPKYNYSIVNDTNTYIFCYGEVDCRCHVVKQVNLGRDTNEVCETLVKNYIASIKHNFPFYKNIILCFIPPTSNREEYERKFNHFPFVGTDEERIYITNTINQLLEAEAKKEGFLFLDCSAYYKNEQGTLRAELSDGNVHIQENTFILDSLLELLQSRV